MAIVMYSDEFRIYDFYDNDKYDNKDLEKLIEILKSFSLITYEEIENRYPKFIRVKSIDNRSLYDVLFLISTIFNFNVI